MVLLSRGGDRSASNSIFVDWLHDHRSSRVRPQPKPQGLRQNGDVEAFLPVNICQSIESTAKTSYVLRARDEGNRVLRKCARETMDDARIAPDSVAS